MNPVFIDLNKALHHVLMHTGMNAVKRGTTNYPFIDFDEYQVLMALLTETNIHPNHVPFFEAFSFRKGSTRLITRNYLYTTGTYHTKTFEPGDLFMYRTNSPKVEEKAGLVLKTNEQKQISSFLAFEIVNYQRRLVLVNETLTPESILEGFQIQSTTEPLPPNSGAFAFYGKFYNEIIKKRGTSLLKYDYTLGGVKGDLSVFDSEGFFKSLSLGAPLHIARLFFLLEYELSDAPRICNTLGKGTQAYSSDTVLQPGTILFTKDTKITLFIGNGNTSSKIPVLIPVRENPIGYTITWLNPEHIQSFWEPSVQAFNYYPKPQNSAFQDLNLLLGYSYALNATFSLLGSSSTSIFSFSLLQQKEIWHPTLYEWFSKMSGRYEAKAWMTYLSAKGKGLIDPTVPIEPGDFLFIENGNEWGSGIALSPTTMIATVGLYSNLPIIKIKNVKKIWRPAIS